ncbi:MAG: hypothetical protein CMO55_21030 [Verrucomicrobiales bacterium]|nr:hypothetical protein [Verrucomicrobiales bacterium]
MTQKNPNPTEPTGWFDKRENVQKLLKGLYGVCGFFVLIDVIFWVTGFDKHPYLKWEKWPAFYAVFGFVACVLLVAVAKYIIRPLTMRGEDYYESNTVEQKGDDHA